MVGNAVMVDSAASPDVAARCFTEQAHEQHAEPYDEQRGKDNASVTGDLADDRAFE
jgi:hypothetical protein